MSVQHKNVIAYKNWYGRTSHSGSYDFATYEMNRDTEMTLHMYLLQTSREDNQLLHSRLPWDQNSIM